METLIQQSTNRCTAILEHNGKRCPRESVPEHNVCLSHLPTEERSLVKKRYSSRLAPTIAKVFDEYTAEENPHDLSAELALMRTMLENTIGMFSQAVEKAEPDDRGIILQLQSMVVRLTKEVAQLAEKSSVIQQRTEKCIPAKMVGVVVSQLIRCVEIATNGDNRVLSRLMEEIRNCRLPQHNMEMQLPVDSNELPV